MRGIFNNLPAFAPDYSGVCSVLYEMDGMIVLLDGDGCSGIFMNFDDARWATSPSRIFSALLREPDVVQGIDCELLQKIKRTYDLVGGKFIALVGTPVPFVEGTDLAGLANEIEAQIGVPVLKVDSSGFGFYDYGITKIYFELIRKFANKKCDGNNEIHIIGCTPLDMWDQNQAREYKEFVEKCTGKKTCVWGLLGSGIEDIATVHSSKFNIAASAAAIPVVQELNRLYGTPYLIGLPLGIRAKNVWESKLNVAIKERQTMLQPDKQNQGRKRALIVGEQVFSNSLRYFLREEFGFGDVVVASFFKLEECISKKNDVHVVDEQDLVELVERMEPLDVVIGDPFIRNLLLTSNKPFIDIPHAPVSSKFTWARSPNIFGEKSSLYFADQLKRLNI